MFPRQIGLTSLMLSVVLGTAVLAGIGAGQKVGIDLGPTATDNWNNITGNGTTPAGSVLTLDGTILAGVSITVADGRFFNNDGADNWVGLAFASPPWLWRKLSSGISCLQWHRAASAYSQAADNNADNTERSGSA